MDIWNEVAPRYHKKWIKPKAAPFNCTSEMLHMLNIRRGDYVLDVACGTGSAITELMKLVGTHGCVVGVDMSWAALNIARQGNPALSNLGFVNGDAETVKFARVFDAITCQFGIFFFPDAPAALLNLKKVLKESGRLGIAVHGQDTPYHTCFIKEVTRYIPDYYKPDMLPLDRYSQIESLYDLVKDAGFADITIRDVTYTFSPGNFTSYWENYIQYIAEPYRQKIESLSDTERTSLQESIRYKTIQYIKDDIIEFPWQVLILGAIV
ncbi:MAG: methyltransferase domain-containing protein [Cenarchaeum sp. SB0665_bin_23]|nr:methyltransferase domain-containing protein [Cenarchaeum sp. SB0667_bin_13]MXY61359.1 methyltransferase domain-containing protein [Cenarchaeum sp. SB0665_bin_23]MXZ93297.1 methyltransferase domain-containing protein [Cenarchaeum sp. SB0666_bin_15]MYB47175.1 methyltransferase domain-containing protein [Cenarchaeum sp. SB0662_bin_33]MYC78950.1 methyltransferase domain-containing protein [Cenarchaeum sp. SB0661_bin_35]MYD58870.1 methyltransferase domain-containing protein [Cenarchaeum sp. SB06